jgi:hypothetical protein
MYLEEFINSPVRNAHIEDPRFTVLYCRKSNRHIFGSYVEGIFEVGNVSAVSPGTGQFTCFLEELKAVWSGPIFIENVMTERFALYLERIGFDRVYDDCLIWWRDV